MLKPVILLGCYVFNFAFTKTKWVMVNERDSKNVSLYGLRKYNYRI